MARYARRRYRRRSAYRKKGRRGTRKTMRRGPRRYGSSKGRIGQSTVYNFTRQTEATLYNNDPDIGPPAITSDNFTEISLPGLDVTGTQMLRHTNFGLTISNKLLNVQNVAEFGALFEYIRIKRITRVFTPIYGSGTANQWDTDTNAPKGFATPTLMVLADRDSNEPVTMAQARETSGVRRVKMNRSFVDSFSPIPAAVVGQSTTGGAVFNALMKRSPWLATNDGSSNIEHYGRRYGVYDWPGPNDGEGVEGDAVPCAWRIISTYHIQCKGLK